MTKINIRFATVDDAVKIAQVHITTWRQIFQKQIPAEILNSLSAAKRTQNWRRLIREQKNVLILEYENELIGFCSFCRARDPDIDTPLCGEISSIYLHPDYLRQGLGKQLLQEGLGALIEQGFTEVILWALQDNFSARHFYTAMGFTLTGHEKIDSLAADNNPALTVDLHEVRYYKQLPLHFSFKPIAEYDLDLLCAWLNKPHVKEWWDDHLTETEIKNKYTTRIQNDSVVQSFIVHLNNQPIGFIQSYLANKVGDGWWPDEEEGTVGIDQFIGEEAYLNRGIGTAMIHAFIKKLYAHADVKKIMTDVDPENKRARRCYEKVGFRFHKQLMTPDGMADLLYFSRNEFAD